MVDILNGVNGPTVRSLVVGACVDVPEIAPIPNQEIMEQRAWNRTWDKRKNQNNAILRTVVRRTQYIFFLFKIGTLSKTPTPS